VITVQGISKYLGKKELFQDVSFHIHSGEKIGLIGPNGAGKTTLFHVLLGETEPDSGNVTMSKSLRMGYLPQQWTPTEEKTVLGHSMDIHQQIPIIRSELELLQQTLDKEKDPERTKEHALRQAHLLESLEHLGGYDLEARSRKILAGLGFKDETLNRPVSSLSGGWVMRLELGRLLLAEPDLLLLDEPTNHLDLESLLWLEQYLLNTSSAVILISHDREFLNRIVQRIMELEQGQFQEYTGNYDRYCEVKAQRQETQLAAYKNQQDKIRQVERFIERNRYRKSTAKRAQSRMKLLEKIDPVEVLGEHEGIHFAFPEPPRSGKRVIELHNVDKSYGDHVVYQGIDMVVERGDRIAFMGANGAGKSTLLKMLAGVESISSGTRQVGSQIIIGYYAQYQWEQLHSEWTILEEASSIAGDMPQSRLRSLLGAFLFRGDDVLKKIAVLSGGEKARLILCKLLLQRPNLLLLDEPTNHLDIPSRDVLEKALRDFPGTVCFISHDRHFINAIANKVVVAEAGLIHILPGNFDDYQTIWKQRIDSPSGVETKPGESVDEKKPQDSPLRKAQEQKRLEAAWRNELYRLRKPVQDRIAELEALLETAHKQLDDLNARLADPNTYQDGSTVQQLQKEYQRCQQLIRSLTSEWEEKALALEELEENFERDKEKVSGGKL
jgi:ATP-binding cassette subfamily F protein 3